MSLMFEQRGVSPGPRSGWAALSRWLGFAALALFALLIVVAGFIAFTAFAVVGAIIAAALFLLRLAQPRREAATGDPTLLEGRRTAEGWVVEAETR